MSGQQRRMASMAQIEQYWLPDGDEKRLLETDALFWLDGFCYLSCFGCGSTTNLQRGHLVNHYLGGGGDVDNLVPLCGRCNQDMPDFGPGQRDYAIRWLRSREAEVTWYCRTMQELIRTLPPEELTVPFGESTIKYLAVALGWVSKSSLVEVAA